MTAGAPRCPCCGAALPPGPAPLAMLPGLVTGPKQRRIVEALIAAHGRPLGYPALADAVYADDPEGGPDGARNCVKMMTSVLRRHVLPRFGWTITSGGAHQVALRLVEVSDPAAGRPHRSGVGTDAGEQTRSVSEGKAVPSTLSGIQAAPASAGGGGRRHAAVPQPSPSARGRAEPPPSLSPSPQGV